MPQRFFRRGVVLGLLLAWAFPGRAAQDQEGAPPVAPAGSGRPSQPSADNAPAGAQVLQDPAQIREAWEIYDQLENHERPRQTLREARRLLERQGVKLLDAEWDTVFDKLQDWEYEKNRATKNHFDTEINVSLRGIQKQLLRIVPPLAVFDAPNDDGTRLLVAWKPYPGAAKYELERRWMATNVKDAVLSEWQKIATPGPNAYQFEDKKLQEIRRYQYRLFALDGKGGRTPLGETAEMAPVVNWFNWDRKWQAVIMLAFGAAVIYYIGLARRGVVLKIRKIAGLEAVDDAVGRATEMGRPILFVPGIQDMDNIQTVAGLIVLGRVARVAAEHDALLEVPTSKSLVMTAAREMVAGSYLNAGRMDAFDEKKIYYVTDEQFGYVAALTGYMSREKPATCIYMGAFFAESLILAETANTAGSIQIAGTAEPSQLPFFVAACDYTLIGEEFFAASAYLSGEPQQLGSLKGQDAGKLLAMVLILGGTLLVTLMMATQAKYSWVGDVVDWLRESFLRTGG